MKINILTAIMLALAILVGSCNAPSDNAPVQGMAT